MMGEEKESGIQTKSENKAGGEIVNIAVIENEVPMVVRPKVRTHVMTGVKPKMKSKGIPGARSKNETSAVGVTHTNGKTKATPSSTSKNDVQVWAQSKFQTESMSKMGEHSQTNAVGSLLVSSDAGVDGETKYLSVDREFVNRDTASFPRKKANSQVEFQPPLGSMEKTNCGSWYSSVPVSKEEIYENPDFKWVDRPSGNSTFLSRDEGSSRFHPRKSMKGGTRSRHMAKQESNTTFNNKTKQSFYIISSSDSEDESLKTSWLWAKEKTSSWSRSREEANNGSYFRFKKEACAESSSGSECENHMTPWFWARGGPKSWSKSRTRKGANTRARFQAKQEACSDKMSGSFDAVRKASCFWPEEKSSAFLMSKTKKETTAREMAKEEAKTKARGSAKQESRSEEEALIGAWFWDTKESGMMDGVNIKSSPHTEDEPVVGSWFRTEVASAETGASHKFRPKIKKEQVDNFCLETEKKFSVESGAKATSQSMLATKDNEVLAGSWFRDSDQPVNPKAKEETAFGSWFWGIGETNARSVGVSCESMPRSEEKGVTDSWFWAREGNTDGELEEQTRPGSVEERIFVPWFWSQKQANMDSRAEANCDLMTVADEEEPIIGPWFWAKVDAGMEAEVTSKSSLEDDDEPIMSSWFGAREEASMKYGAAARCKLMAETEDTDERSCFWTEGPCIYSPNRESLKSSLEEREDTIDSWLWPPNNYARPEATVGSWLWTAEESSIDNETGEEVKLPTVQENILTSWFWKGNEAIIEATDREESRQEAEEENIPGSSLWAGKEDSFQLPAAAREESKVVAKGEATVASWFWGKEEAIREAGFGSKYSLKVDEEATGSWSWEEEASLKATRKDTFESKPEIKEEEIVGSWFWTEEATGNQAVEEITSEPEEETIFGSWFWAEKEDKLEEERVPCVSKIQEEEEKEEDDDDEIIVESWFWSGNSVTEEVETVDTVESRPENNDGSTVELLSSDEMNNKTGNRVSSEFDADAETIVGSWFWAGDEAQFESNPIPVFRDISKSGRSTEEEPDPSRRPQSWDEVTVTFKPGLWSRIGFLSIGAYRCPKEAASMFSEMFGGKSRRMEHSPHGEEQGSLDHSKLEFPFQYDPSYRSVQEIREHLKAKESSQPDGVACSCIQCVLGIGSKEFEELLILMDKVRDPIVHEISKIAMGIRCSSQYTRNFIRQSGIVSLIETLLNIPPSRVRTKFLEDMMQTTPPYPDLNMIQTYVCQICEETFAHELNSPEQLHDLMMIRHLTTTTDYHPLVAKYLCGFLRLLVIGNSNTRFHVLKMLLNLSENLVMTKELLSTDSMSKFMEYFNREQTNENIKLVLEVFENINNNIKKEALFAVEIDDGDDDFDLETLISTFHEVEKIAKDLQSKLSMKIALTKNKKTNE